MYWFLVYEREAKDKVLKRLAMDERTFNKILLRLDRLGLIEFGIQDKVKVPKTRPVRWAIVGRFVKKVFKDWSMGILSEGIEGEKDSALILQYFQLTENSRIELMDEIKTLEEKYAVRTIHELNLKLEDLKKVRFLLSTASGSFLK